MYYVIVTIKGNFLDKEIKGFELQNATLFMSNKVKINVNLAIST